MVREVKTTLKDQPLQWQCSDKRILFLAWNTEHIPSPSHTAAVQSNEHDLIDLVSHIKVAHEYSFKGLDKLLTPFNEVKARDYAKQLNPITKGTKQLKTFVIAYLWLVR
ncbi:hypothetical protein ACOBV9_21055 (plasmid) [Pseudoalteromonas espejiana]